MLQFDEGFVTSLKHLFAHEWKHAVQVAMDVQDDHRSLSLHVEPIHAARDNHLYSVRVNNNLRIIVVERGECLIPCAWIFTTWRIAGRIFPATN